MFYVFLSIYSQCDETASWAHNILLCVLIAQYGTLTLPHKLAMHKQTRAFVKLGIDGLPLPTTPSTKLVHAGQLSKMKNGA